jgi:hypothetical protein
MKERKNIMKTTSQRMPYFHTIDWRALGTALGLFFAISFVLCVGFDLIFPAHAMYQSWMKLLPGFTWLSWGSFFLGLIESFAYGYYVALVFCPLYNHFSKVFAVRDARALSDGMLRGRKQVA